MSEQAEQLDSELAKQVEIIRREAMRRRVVAYPLMVFLLFAGFGVAAYLAVNALDNAATRPFAISCFFSPWLFGMVLVALPAKRQMAALRTICERYDVQSINALCATEPHLVGVKSRLFMLDALGQRLLRLTEEDADQLSNGARQIINSYDFEMAKMKVERGECALAILHALQFVGTSKCLRRVKLCTQWRSKRPHAIAMREKAIEVLPKIEARLAELSTQQSLLRSADAPNEQTLLQPAGFGATELDMTLVRPVLNSQAPE